MSAQFLGQYPLYSVDCRKLSGSHWFERTTPTYVEDSGVFLWVGCHPTFVAGPSSNIDHHKIKTGGPTSGHAALEDMYRNMIEPNATLAMACTSGGSHGDRICGAAVSNGIGTCVPSGSDFVRCDVPSNERKRLLRH
jgi:hypothetical protein